MSILQTVVADLEKVGHFVVAEAEGAATVLWNDVKPLIEKVEPTAYAQLKVVVAGVVGAFAQGTSPAAIEKAVLVVLEAGGTTLLATAKGLEGNILQLIISLVKAA